MKRVNGVSFRCTAQYAHQLSILTAQSNLTWADGEWRVPHPITALQRAQRRRDDSVWPHRYLALVASIIQWVNAKPETC
ncbi:hypothetical protein VZT92_025279 [Zoarces viviparus]|uniref:Uncharacterized protein n=1 Tax=Zoarces viviparus TaxID=48416 RepID=A0AAW1E452_ZOAVI